MSKKKTIQQQSGQDWALCERRKPMPYTQMLHLTSLGKTLKPRYAIQSHQIRKLKKCDIKCQQGWESKYNLSTFLQGSVNSYNPLDKTAGCHLVKLEMHTCRDLASPLPGGPLHMCTKTTLKAIHSSTIQIWKEWKHPICPTVNVQRDSNENKWLVDKFQK